MSGSPSTTPRAASSKVPFARSGARGVADPGYAHVDVREPGAGRWSAVLFTASVGSAAAYSGPYG